MEADKFRQVFEELLNYIMNVMGDMADDGLTDLDTTSVQVIVSFVHLMDSLDMVNKFSEYHQTWEAAYLCDCNFILVDIPSIYPDLDTSVIREPIIVYNRLKETKGGSLGPDEDDWPVNADIISTMWKFYRRLIELCCLHIHREMDPVKLADNTIHYRKRDVHKSFPIEKYCSMFKINALSA
jgi:hypothetical protein